MQLRNGEALVDEFNCKIVCFHPHSQVLLRHLSCGVSGFQTTMDCKKASDSYGLQEGDEIVIRTKEGGGPSDLTLGYFQCYRASTGEQLCGTILGMTQGEEGASNLRVQPPILTRRSFHSLEIQG